MSLPSPRSLGSARLPLLAALLGGSLAAQGQVHVVVDGAPADLGAVWMLDIEDDGRLQVAPLELGDVTPGLAGALAVGDEFGSAVVLLGDLDGNGAVDLAVGAPGDDTGGAERGAVWIVLRTPGGDVAGRRAIRSGEGLAGALADRARFGAALAHLGDLDGDGTTELAVGAPYSASSPAHPGEVWLLSLAPDASVTAETRIGAGTGGFMGALDDRDRFGAALAALGDRDGDGIADLAVGAPGDDDGGSNSGALWLVHLAGDGRVRSERKLSRTAGGLGTGHADGDQLGTSACALGDLDANGVHDLAVGAPADDGGAPNAGAVWILFLNADGTVATEQVLGRGAGGLSNPSHTAFGTSVAPLGDLDTDGVLDLAVGAGGSGGAVFLLFLHPAGTVAAQVIHSASIPGLASGDGLGASLARLGDLDLDGRLDLVAGASGRDGVPAGFVTLQAAIDAAASGDTILLRDGHHGPATLETKALTVVAATAGAASVADLRVSELAASQTVVVSGVNVANDFAPTASIVLEDNAGTVWIEDTRLAFAPTSATAGLDVSACARVVLSRVLLAPATDAFSSQPIAPRALALHNGSAVHAYDSTFRGAPGFVYQPGFGQFVEVDGADAIVCTSSDRLLLSGCTASGGSGSPTIGGCPSGGDGVRSDAAEVWVLDSLVSGGSGSTCGDGLAFRGSNVSHLSGASLAFSTGPLAREGEDVVFEFRGPPDTPVWLMGSPFPRTEPDPVRHGTLLVGTPRVFDFMGTTDASGALDVLVPLGLLAPGFDVRRTFLQPLMIEGARSGPAVKARARPSRVTLGAGSAFLVLDQSF